MMPGTGIYPGTTGVPTGELLGTPTQNKAKGQESKDQSALSSTKATLVIELPANSKLFIDDRLVKVPAGVRSFDTPALAPGQLYYYMVRLEMVRDGKPVSETRRIIVHAGQVVRADFQGLKPETVRTAQAK